MAEQFELSDEQQAILEHDYSTHARVLAGPGTGKSFTATVWLGHLTQADSSLRAKMLTFTRAATAEFAGKLASAGLADVVDEPATVHSHALSVLMRAEGHGLPAPIRIPDSWEVKTLVRPFLSRQLKKRGFGEATPTLVKDLEAEMAAGWDKLDETTVLLADVRPELRTAYIAAWQGHRSAFGYSLLAELPYRAAQFLEDYGEDQPPALDLLLVDEYQDLNAADIKFVKAHAAANIAVVAIGDDDQSIYGWRHADPAGIRRFDTEFTPATNYSLTISRRCGRSILTAANELISVAPHRAAKPQLRTTDMSSDGAFAYLRFDTGEEEASGAALLAEKRIDAGVDPSNILLLVRSVDDRWRRELDPHFAARGLTIAGTDWVDDAIADPRLRAVVALGRLRESPTDSLSWWSLLEGLTPNVGPAFTQHVYDSLASRESWGQAVLRLRKQDFPDLTAGNSARASTTIDVVESRLEELEEVELDDDATLGWAGWILDELANAQWLNVLAPGPPTAEAVRLLELVGPHITSDSGLSGVLNQMEPVGRDLAAAEHGGIRLMGMAKSKGLTVDTSIVLGVEEGIVPFPRSDDEEEERRLLYVAMTRAQAVCILTSASRRTGPLARSGSGKVRMQRGRSNLVRDLSWGEPRDGMAFVRGFNSSTLR